MAKNHNGVVNIDDSKMYYVSFGSGSKKLIVIPGLSDGLSSVKDKALVLSQPYREFLDEYTVYMFSRKENMSEGYSIADMAKDQKKALDSLGIEKAYIMGVSQGGMIAQSLAIEYPELVEKLVLVVSASYANEVIKENVLHWCELAEHDEHYELMMDSARKMYTEDYMVKNKMGLGLAAHLIKPKKYDRFLINCKAILDFDVRNALSKITCPTFIIAGDEDQTVGTKACYELHAGIETSDLFVYTGLGHGLFEETMDFYSIVHNWCSFETK